MIKYNYNLGLLFDEVVNRCGSNIALKYADNNYSYLELNNKANNLVKLLFKRGLSQGDVVAIANTKKVNSFALMIACIKTGIIYTNIDIDGPAERLEKIFKTCKPKIVFSDEKSDVVKKASEHMSIEHFLLTDELLNKNNEYQYSIMEQMIKVDGSSIAYIMFTSGSTGIPKGAAITHQNLIHFISWSHTFIEIRHNDVFANLSPMYFDNSVFDFFSALFSGSCLAPIRQDIIENPLLLVNYIDDLKCTIWFSVPSMLRYLINMKGLSKKNFKYIRTIIFGGEGYPKKDLFKLYKLYNERVDIFNVYGPTECTCICSAKKIEEEDFADLRGLPSLGSLNQNFGYLILDKKNNETSEGELCLIGPNVGVGYYNDRKRTSESFFDCEEKVHYGKKLYKTGDLVKEKNAFLYFKGRLDNQIKHMGYRIELEEIEQGLNEIKGVDQAAVMYKKYENNGQIIAFISLNEVLPKNKIEEELSKIIPTYMIPHKIKILNTLPLNKNGKIDKNSLISKLKT